MKDSLAFHRPIRRMTNLPRRIIADWAAIIGVAFGLSACGRPPGRVPPSAVMNFDFGRAREPAVAVLIGPREAIICSPVEIKPGRAVLLHLDRKAIMARAQSTQERRRSMLNKLLLSEPVSFHVGSAKKIPRRGRRVYLFPPEKPDRDLSESKVRQVTPGGFFQGQDIEIAGAWKVNTCVFSEDMEFLGQVGIADPISEPPRSDVWAPAPI